MSMEADELKRLPRSERVETLPNIEGEVIDQISKEDRLAPEPDVDHKDVKRRAKENNTSELRELGEAMKGLPRSQRVQIAFDWRPTDYQALVLDYGEEKARAQVAPKAGRQVGKTEIAGIIGADHALTNRNTDVLYAAPGQDTADEMFDEFKDAFKHGPFSKEQYGVTKDNETEWKFEGGTRASSRTLGAVEQDDNPGNRGRNPTCVIIDEAAYERDKVYTEEIEEFFITHPEYEYYLFSTPAPNNYFEERANPDKLGFQSREEALEEEWSWYAPYWPTKISPFAQQDFIERKREEYDKATFEKEFLGVFPDDSGSAIPHSTLVPNLKPDITHPREEKRVLAIDPARQGSDEMVAFDLGMSGRYWNAWSFETINGPVFIEFLHGVHTGERHDADIDVPWPGGWPEPDVGNGRLPNGGYQTILIEENGVGGFAADFAKAGLGGVVKVVNQTNKTKQNIYQRFIKDLEGEELALPNHRKLVNQATKLKKTFTPTGKAKYEHPPGGHDDWPDAVAMANWARHGGGERLEVETGRSSKAVISF